MCIYEASIYLLGEHIMNHKDSFHMKRKQYQRFDLKKNSHVCFLSNGSVNLYRATDNFVHLTINSPNILGISQLNFEMKHHYIRCNQDCDMWILDINCFKSILDENDLWKHAFNILSWQLSIYYTHEQIMFQPTVKKIVEEHIKYIWNMSAADRDKLSLYTYILSRNHISRSALHKALVELKTEGMINTKRGRLLECRL